MSTPPRPRRGLRLTQLAAGLALAAVGVTIGDNYIPRLPDHRGFFLVPVDDVVRATPPPRPRHTVVVVADGLGLAPARGMQVTARLQAAGQCRVTEVGPISVSRPVYAVISTGLEQDRTGARNNDETSPLAAQSIWEVARAAGLEVTGTSDVPWWQQLFPRGFDHYSVRPEAENYFADLRLTDLTLVHPAYIDHLGHASGSASAEYAAGVARLDAELGPFLDRLDLARDLVIFTADHGHAARGGHGGPSPEIAQVLTCFAGRGVIHQNDGDAITARTLAGTLAVLLGVPFPKHMRALDDELDAIFTIVDPTPTDYPADYLADRRAAIAHRRAENQAALTAWLGHPGTWADLHAARATPQRLRAALVALITIAAFTLAARRRRLGLRGTVALALACLTIAAATALLHILVLGSLDWTAINLRERYLVAAPLICAAPALLAIAIHAWRLRDLDRLVADQLTLAALALALDLGHIFIYSWPLGFPLPGPTMLLLPFFASFFLVVHALLAALLAAAALLRPPRPPRTA